MSGGIPVPSKSHVPVETKISISSGVSIKLIWSWGIPCRVASLGLLEELLGAAELPRLILEVDGLDPLSSVCSTILTSGDTNVTHSSVSSAMEIPACQTTLLASAIRITFNEMRMLRAYHTLPEIGNSCILLKRGKTDSFQV